MCTQILYNNATLDLQISLFYMHKMSCITNDENSPYIKMSVCHLRRKLSMSLLPLNVTLRSRRAQLTSGQDICGVPPSRDMNLSFLHSACLL